jgi:hypothetical protein
MDLGGLSVHFGPEGFLSYLLPLILLLCGVLVWVTPNQRLFYGIIAALTSVYSLIGLNLGGFFLGMLLGVLGSSLAIAWTPVRLENPPAEPAPGPEPEPEEPGYGEYQGDTDDTPTVRFDELMTGPLTDTLPPPVNPLTERGSDDERDTGPGAVAREPPTAPLRPAEPESWHRRPPNSNFAASGDNPPTSGPGGSLPRRPPRLFSLLVIMLAVVAVAVVTARAPRPAYAEPCQPTTTATPATASTGSTGSAEPALVDGVIDAAGAAIADALATSEIATPSPSAAATPTPEASAADGASPTPVAAAEASASASAGSSPTPTPSADAGSSPTPAASASAGSSPTPSVGASGSTQSTPGPDPDCDPTPSASVTASASPGLTATVAADQPPVAPKPAQLKGSRVTMTGLTYDGVAELPTTSGGTVRALRFSMDESVITDFTLTTPEVNGTSAVFRTDKLTVQGGVEFYATRFAGNLCEPVTQPDCTTSTEFTPDSPPTTLDDQMAFTDPDIQLVFVGSDTLTGQPSLSLTVES